MPEERGSLLANGFARVILSVASVLLGILVLSLQFRSPVHQHIATYRSAAPTSSVYNRTLGFQKVFAIGFSSRTDKRDALSVASSLSEFDITWNEGVLLEDMPEKAIPEIFTNATFEDRAIACWRAHLNVLRRIVDENIQTALVLEDDNDWDINLKPQLEEFARGAVALQRDDPGTYPRGSPYGSNWDTLWLGHCHIGPADTGRTGPTQQMYFIRNDSTVPPVPLRFGWWDNSHIIPEVLSNDTRIVMRTNSGMCMWGHAITLQAARKVLTFLSLEAKIGRQIDGALSKMVSEGNLKSYSVYPPLISSYRFAGSKYRDSDIHDHDQDVRHEAFSYNIVYSTLLNAMRLVQGAKDVLSQWPKDTIPVRGLGEKYGDQVTGELREVDLQSVPRRHLVGVNAKGKLDVNMYRSLLSAWQME